LVARKLKCVNIDVTMSKIVLGLFYASPVIISDINSYLLLPG
jgi:hypothetical protein